MTSFGLDVIEKPDILCQMPEKNALLNMYPGAAALGGITSSAESRQSRANRQPNSAQHRSNLQAREAARVAGVRRSRLTAQLQGERRSAGQVPLSQRELDTALSEMGIR